MRKLIGNLTGIGKTAKNGSRTTYIYWIQISDKLLNSIGKAYNKPTKVFINKADYEYWDTLYSDSPDIFIECFNESRSTAKFKDHWIVDTIAKGVRPTLLKEAEPDKPLV